MKKINQLIDRLVYEGDKKDPETYWKAKFFVVALVLFALIAVGYMPYYLSPSADMLPYSKELMIFFILLVFSSFYIYPKYGYRNQLFLVLGTVSGAPSWISTYYSTGGLYSADGAFSAVMIIFVYFVTNKKIGLISTLLSIAVYAFFYYADISGWHDFKSDVVKQTPEYFFSSIVVSFALAALLPYLYERSKDRYLVELKQTKELVEHQKEEILASITYAKRIQQAKLPHPEDITNSLPNSFVLFRPKDIVSGDFYFFKKTEQYVYIAAADCTGHGVPGAIISMICSEKLEDAIKNNEDPSDILTNVNNSLKTTLRQTASDDSTRDGMDIALCRIDTNTKTVKYAGANRPIWVYRNGQAKVEEIKGTKKAIGGFTEDNQPFESHEIKFQANDSFYLSTDGYADSFDAKGKKLTTKKFKELIQSVQDKSLKEQAVLLSNFIDNWKQGTEQIDDILVIGVRL